MTDLKMIKQNKMKTLILLFTVALVLLAGACQQATRTEYTNNSVTTTQTSQPTGTDPLDLKVDPANFSLAMDRTACKGTCPVYSVSVQPDGKITFEGRQHTATKGRAEHALGKAKMEELAAAINTTKLANILRDDYTESSGNCPDFATDMPTVNLTIESRGQKRSFKNNLGCIKQSEFVAYPPELVELEKQIDHIIGTERWIGSGK